MSDTLFLNPTRDKMKTVYDKLKSVNELDSLGKSEKLCLYEIGSSDLKDARTKVQIQVLYKDLLKMYKSAVKSIENLEESLSAKKKEIVDLKNSAITKESSSQMWSNQSSSHLDKYSNYADAVKNEQKESIVIVRKKADDDRIDLFKETDTTLTKLKKDVMIKKIVNKKFSVIVKTANDLQRDKIIEEINKSESISANKEHVKIPSILIKDINKDLKESDIIEELAINEGIDKNSLRVKKLIENTRYKTNRIIINFKIDDTKRIIRNGYVKLGYYCCPIEPIFNRCYCCGSYYHQMKNKQGELVCNTAKRKKKVCFKCSDEFDFDTTHTCKSSNKVNQMNSEATNKAIQQPKVKVDEEKIKLLNKFMNSC